MNRVKNMNSTRQVSTLDPRVPEEVFTGKELKQSMQGANAVALPGRSAVDGGGGDGAFEIPVRWCVLASRRTKKAME